MARRRVGSLFALIIGIDDYTKCPKLRGAVTDANAVKEYLKVDLQVPEDHILTLLDRKATRDAIVEAFEKLQNDERINKEDAIVIFYAGHGGECYSPLTWNREGMVQCLIPQDCEVTGTTPLPIPDRTVGALIERIAETKGDNITVIFDCCHSASGTRGLDDEYTTRSVDLRSINIPETLDDHICGGRAMLLANGFAHHGLQSHVLLATCRERESAYERNGRGLFTSALLSALRSSFREGLTLTYSELLKRILRESKCEFKRQHPQCEGLNQNRILFNGKVTPDGISYPVKIRKGATYVISAGLAHGVLPGIEFALYDCQKYVLGVVPIDERSVISDFETTVTPSVLIDGVVSFAKLNRLWETPLHVHLSSTLESYLCGSADTQRFRLVRTGEAKLDVAMEGNHVVFDVLDKRLRRLGLVRLPYRATLESIARVLGSVARYYWFLDLEKKETEAIVAKHDVAINFYCLASDGQDDYGEQSFSLVRPGLCHSDPDSNDSDIIELLVDPDKCYGMTIANKTPWDLYLNVFIFNSRDCSIIPYYTQSSTGEPEAPLKKGETFVIGYENGTPPFSFALDDEQDADVSFLKLFCATQPIDLSNVAQLSPFERIGAREGEEDDTAKEATLSKLLSLAHKKHTWFTIVIPIVQRRR